MENKIATFHEMITSSQRIVFFTGAGISTESGIPDFRSAGGLFNQKLKRDIQPEEMISHDFFMRYPKDFYDYYFKHLVFPDSQPNSGHLFMAELEKAGKKVDIVTQNIDGLHQKAGSQRVYELHGTTQQYSCMACGEQYAYDDLQLDGEGIPRCPHDDGIVRPNIVLYQEALPEEAIVNSIQAIEQADMLIIVGTSLVVYPAASFVQYYSGHKLVVINKTDITPLRQVDLNFTDSMGNVMSAYKKYQK